MNNLSNELKSLISNQTAPGVASKFLERLKQDNFTRDENSKSHFCVYFAAYDPQAKEIFIGHHKKSGLWLFNGGHIDRGETIKETAIREIGEEWGLDGNDFKILPPSLFTITEINNPTKQPCNFHYDIWCFIAIDKDNFKPDRDRLSEEFHEAGWKSTIGAKNLTKDKSTFKAIEFIENTYFNK